MLNSKLCNLAHLRALFFTYSHLILYIPGPSDVVPFEPWSSFFGLWRRKLSKPTFFVMPKKVDHKNDVWPPTGFQPPSPQSDQARPLAGAFSHHPWWCGAPSAWWMGIVDAFSSKPFWVDRKILDWSYPDHWVRIQLHNISWKFWMISYRDHCPSAIWLETEQTAI